MIIFFVATNLSGALRRTRDLHLNCFRLRLCPTSHEFFALAIAGRRVYLHWRLAVLALNDYRLDQTTNKKTTIMEIMTSARGALVHTIEINLQ